MLWSMGELTVSGLLWCRIPIFAFSLGSNYTDLYMQSYICIREHWIWHPALCNHAHFSAEPCDNLGRMSFYSNKQHFAYADVMGSLLSSYSRPRLFRNFTGGDTLFLNPRMLGAPWRSIIQKPFIGLKIDLFKGLSYKTTWNYYGYNLRQLRDVPGLSQSGQRIQRQ